MYPDSTIEDQKINSMHDALERARGFLKHQAMLFDSQDFTVQLRQPKRVFDDEGDRYECTARVTVRLSSDI